MLVAILGQFFNSEIPRKPGSKVANRKAKMVIVSLVLPVHADSQDKITHKLWKDKVRGEVSIPLQAHKTRSRTNCGRTKCEVGSASHCRLTGQDHAQAVEGQSARWGQHPIAGQDHAQAVEGHSARWGQHTIAGSQDKITHKLWKDKVGGGVSIPSHPPLRKGCE
jgi:hypothetical protein